MSTASTILSAAESLVSAAIPGLGTATAGLKLTDDLISAAAKVRDSYQTPGMILSDEQQKRLVAARAILEMQQTGDVEKMRATLGSLSSLALACLLALSLSACGFFRTVSPQHVEASPSIDQSTPPQYGTDATSGYLGDEVDLKGVRHHLITSKGRDIYDRAIVRYAPQLQAYFNVAPLPADAGLTPYVDRFGNHVYQLDDEHMQDFLRAGDVAANPALYPVPTTR